jgi:hypothetical protein
VPAIKRTYLFEHGAPLLVDGRRRDADRLTPRDPYAPGQPPHNRRPAPNRSSPVIRLPRHRHRHIQHAHRHRTAP